MESLKKVVKATDLTLNLEGPFSKNAAYTDTSYGKIKASEQKMLKDMESAKKLSLMTDYDKFAR